MKVKTADGKEANGWGLPRGEPFIIQVRDGKIIISEPPPKDTDNKPALTNGGG